MRKILSFVSGLLGPGVFAGLIFLSAQADAAVWLSQQTPLNPEQSRAAFGGAASVWFMLWMGSIKFRNRVRSSTEEPDDEPSELMS